MTDEWAREPRLQQQSTKAIRLRESIRSSLRHTTTARPDIRLILIDLASLSTSDVKRGQFLEAEAEVESEDKFSESKDNL